jgi:hypothetical protein
MAGEYDNWTFGSIPIDANETAYGDMGFNFEPSGVLPLDTPGVNNSSWVSGNSGRYNFTTDSGDEAIGGGAGSTWSNTPAIQYGGNVGYGFNAPVPTKGIPADAGGAGGKKSAGSGGAALSGATFPYPGTSPTFTAPTYTPPAPYVAPAWNERKVAYQTQKAASPYLAEIRRSIRQAITRSGVSGNPILQKYAVGGAMEAAGGAFGKVMGQAGDTGLKNYTAEYGRDLNAYNMNYGQSVDTAKMNYQGKMTEAQANFSNQLAAFQAALKGYYSNPGGGGYGSGSSLGYYTGYRGGV